MTWRGMEAGLYQEGQESRLFPFVDLNGGVLNFDVGSTDCRGHWPIRAPYPHGPRSKSA
jgi:hypothetical protein